MSSSQSAARSTELSWSKSRSSKLAGLFHRHELKLLNLSLVIYLCFGVAIFEILGEFDRELTFPKQLRPSDAGRQSNATETGWRNSSLIELREVSARRMWNITNRLNILYESNWTRLMLDELREFERQLLDKLMQVAARERKQGEQDEDDAGDDGYGDEADKDDDEQDDKESKRKKSGGRGKNRAKSLRKSLIHSLSTITTVGFSHKVRSSAAKLATVLYGLLGIPLLFSALAKTGKQVALSGANALLMARHYCIALPIHYLCCSCTLYGCFRCLLWCCCCCCCSYLCCCLTKKRQKSGCCDPGSAPKLRLIERSSARRYRRPPQDGATRAALGQQQTPFVIGAPPAGRKADSLEGTSSVPQSQSQSQSQFEMQQQKSVRFMSNSKKCPSAKLETQNDQSQDDDDHDDDHYEPDDFGYTQSIFFTSLFVLTLYLLLGAYFYSTYTNSSLIDALFVCYSMLSTSKFADQITQTDQIYSDPRTLYESLNASSSSHKPIGAEESIESEMVKWIYLLIGLNLISACGHFAKLWLSNKLRLEECPVETKSSKPVPAICNGQVVHSLNESQQSPTGSSNQQAGPGLSRADMLQLAPNIGQIISSADYDNLPAHQHSIYQHQQQQQQQPLNQSQVDLSELFLVQKPSQDSSSDIQFVAGLVQQQQQPLAQTSDISLTSDRSTDHGSLCHHHQMQQRHVHPTSGPNSTEPSLYTHSIYDGNAQLHRRHPSQSHLCLSSMPSHLSCGEQQPQGGDHFMMANGLDCDEADEMQQMVKSYVDGSGSNKLRSSSSSTQLSHLSGSSSQHNQQVSGSSSSTVSRVRASFDKQTGQDPTNEPTNSLSSTTSSRTVKLPHLRSNQHIGFILAPEHQRTLN